MIYTVTLNPTIDRTMVFPRLDVGELNRATQSRTDLSGKGVNVSVALRQLGLESTMVGISAGVYGRLLINGLRDMGYECDFIEVAGETRSNVTVIDAGRNETTKLNEPGPTVNADDLAALADRLAARIAPGDLCVFSGSLPPGAPDDTYARLVAIVQKAGGRAVLDTSGPALKAGCPAAPDLLKPNEVEALELVAHSLDGDAALLKGLQEIAAMGPPRVLMSLGARGGRLSGCERRLGCHPAGYRGGQRRGSRRRPDGGRAVGLGTWRTAGGDGALGRGRWHGGCLARGHHRPESGARDPGVRSSAGAPAVTGVRA